MAIRTIPPAGFVRSYRSNSAVQQEAALKAYGVKVIYNADKGETVKNARGRLRKKGELLAVYGGLRALAEKRDQVAAAVDYLRAEGFHVFDILTEECSSINGVAMMNKAWKTFNAEDRVPDLEKAKAFGALGGIAKGHNAKRGRMPKTKALKIWRDKTTYRTIAEALEHMPKWTKETANRHLGPRGDVPGRRKR